MGYALSRSHERRSLKQHHPIVHMGTEKECGPKNGTDSRGSRPKPDPESRIPNPALLPAEPQRPDALVQVRALHSEDASCARHIPVRLLERLDDALAFGRVADAVEIGRWH
jgi:hypothetical protein